MVGTEVTVRGAVTERGASAAGASGSVGAAAIGGTVPRDVLAMLAHDLLGSLSNILGFAGLLEVQLVDQAPEPRRMLTRLLANARHMQTMLEGTLTALKQASEPVRADPVDVGNLLVAAAERHAVLAGPKGVALHIDAPSEPLVIASDRTAVARIVDNLVANALKHAPKGSRVTLAGRREGFRVRLVVSDQGGGVPGLAAAGVSLADLPPELAKLAPSRGGHGLGLAIVQRLSRLLGGEAGVVNGDRGATFWVLLPARPDAADRIEE